MRKTYAIFQHSIFILFSSRGADHLFCGAEELEERCAFVLQSNFLRLGRTEAAGPDDLYHHHVLLLRSSD